MAGPRNRIRELREGRGLSGPRLAALVGTDASMVNRLENGRRKLTQDWMERIAPHLGVKPMELVDPDGAPSNDTGAERVPVLAEGGADQASRRSMIVREYDIWAGAGGGDPPSLAGGGDGTEPPVLAVWQVPREFLPDEYRNATVAIIRVRGKSMAPDLMPEDRVMVDLTHTFPRPDGTYLASDGVGLVLKRLQLFPGKPPMVRFTSNNADFDAYDVPLSEVRVIGRVIGKWAWQ